MINYKKLLLVAGAAVLLGGCSLDLNSMLKVMQPDTSPTPTPTPDTQTYGSPTPSTTGTMGSGSYTMQGTTTLGTGDDDATLEKDLNEVNVNSNLEMMVQ